MAKTRFTWKLDPLDPESSSLGIMGILPVVYDARGKEILAHFAWLSKAPKHLWYLPKNVSPFPAHLPCFAVDLKMNEPFHAEFEIDVDEPVKVRLFLSPLAVNDRKMLILAKDLAGISETPFIDVKPSRHNDRLAKAQRELEEVVLELKDQARRHGVSDLKWHEQEEEKDFTKAVEALETFLNLESVKSKPNFEHKVTSALGKVRELLKIWEKEEHGNQQGVVDHTNVEVIGELDAIKKEADKERRHVA